MSGKDEGKQVGTKRNVDKEVYLSHSLVVRSRMDRKESRQVKYICHKPRFNRRE